MLGAADPDLARSAHSESLVDGGGTLVHAMDINGARRRSHEPTSARPELGLGWPELGLGWPEPTHRWTGTTCRAASLDCSRGE